MITNKILLTAFALLFGVAKPMAQDTSIAFVGGTIMNVSNYGNDVKDIPDAVVIIKNGSITAAGKRSKTPIPAGAKIIHVEGKYLMPGLIDCFSVIGTQGQANAHLYMGVTTIVAGPGDDRRKGFIENANPSPDIKKLTTIPFEWLEDTLEKKPFLSPSDIIQVNKEIDSLDWLEKQGYSVVLIQHMFPEQLLAKLSKETRRLNIATIGEMQYAHYNAGLTTGVGSFVHTSRYILGAMPDSIFIPATRSLNDTVANKKFGHYFYHADLATDSSFNQFAKNLASSQTALMPTLSMLYTSMPDHQNIWKEAVSKLIDPNDVFLPMDTATGKSTSWMTTKSALRQIEIEKAFIKKGVHYITGSGADAFGSLPGISELIEMEMLHSCGLSNREALAAATSNAALFNGWNHIGQIQTGKKADLLVLSANPVDDLENLRKIEMIWLNGKQVNRNALLIKP